MTAVESPLVVDNSVVPTRPSSSCSSRSGTHRYRHGTPPPIAPVLGRSEQEIVRISKAILGEVPCGMNQAPTAEDVRDVKDVLYEHWNDVVRLRRHLDFCRNGYIPAVAFCKALSQELAFRKASDVRVLAQIVLGCLIDGESLPPHPLAQRGEGLVDIRLLWKSVQRSFKGTEWKKRFRAAGVMPVSLQRHTTGVDVNTRTHYEGPPYAVSGDSDHMKLIVKEYFIDRCARMRDILQRYGSKERPGLLTPAEFKRAMFAMEHHSTNDRELNSLIDVLDKHNTGMISITEFLDRFSMEYLKGRSMRLSVGPSNNDGRSNTLQWPASMQPEFQKKALMETLRTRQFKSRRVANSRSSSLRKKHGRESRERADHNPFFPQKRHADTQRDSLSASRPEAKEDNRIFDDSLSEMNRRAGEADITQESNLQHKSKRYMAKRSGSGGGPQAPLNNLTKAEKLSRPVKWRFVTPNAHNMGNQQRSASVCGSTTGSARGGGKGGGGGASEDGGASGRRLWTPQPPRPSPPTPTDTVRQRMVEHGLASERG